MAKEDAIEVEGTVRESLPNTMFRVKLQNGHRILAPRSGTMRSTTFASCPATASRSPYDLNRGRITYREL